MPADVLVDLGTGMAIIGVMIALFVRVDSKIDRVDSKFESRFDKVDTRFEKMDSKFESRFEKMDTRFEKMDSKFDSRFEKMDSKFDSRFDKVDTRFEKMDSKFDAMAQDIVDIKVSVARIEGYLQARDGFRPAGSDRPTPRPDVDQPPTSYRQTG